MTIRDQNTNNIKDFCPAEQKSHIKRRGKYQVLLNNNKHFFPQKSGITIGKPILYFQLL